MNVVAETLGVARSKLIDRLKGGTKPCRLYYKLQDAAVVPLITALVIARPTYGSGAPLLNAAPTAPYRTRLIRLAFLAPEIQRAILAGRHSRHLTLARLIEADIPLSWAEQQDVLADLLAVPGRSG